MGGGTVAKYVENGSGDVVLTIQLVTRRCRVAGASLWAILEFSLSTVEVLPSGLRWSLVV